MEGERFDVLVIGGGINGTAVAREAARRGLSVGLVEKHDFGWGTTAGSTRLIHGGLRYLETFDFGLVREGLKEREALLHLAPHLVKPLPFLTPVYKASRRGPLAMRAGMYLYDLLSYDKSLPAHRWLAKDELLALEPKLNPEGLLGGALYYDAQVDLPERMCVEHALDAAAHGAMAANYAEVIDIRFDAPASCYRVRVLDRLQGKEHTLQALLIVNAAGPWADAIPGSGAAAGRLRKTKGVHVLVEAFTRRAVVQLAQRDGRVFFTVPWRGYSLIGTTDTDYAGDPGEAAAERDDVAYLLEETRRYFPSASLERPYLATAGIRALVSRRPGESESKVSRRQEVIDSDPKKPYGVLTILGGKITNHRVVAAQTVDALQRKLGKGVRGSTRDAPFYGGAFDKEKDPAAWKAEYRFLGLSDEVWKHLVSLYGARVPEVLEPCRRDPALARPVAPGSKEIVAQVVYAVEKEMCRRTSDFLLRRTGAGLLPRGMEAHQGVRQVLAELLGWDADEIAADERQTEWEASRLAVPRDLSLGQGALD